jgi:hypothetical protein
LSCVRGERERGRGAKRWDGGEGVVREITSGFFVFRLLLSEESSQSDDICIDLLHFLAGAVSLCRHVGRVKFNYGMPKRDCNVSTFWRERGTVVLEKVDTREKLELIDL